ncbi:MAG: HAD family hydrolase [Erysipelotrichaceae bacterium]
MNNIKLVVTDMDGTLLQEHSYVDEETKKGFQALMEQGILVALASGRGYERMIPFAKELGLDQQARGFLITLNGQKVHYLQDNQIEEAASLPIEQLPRWVRFGVLFGLEILVYTNQGEIRYMSKITQASKKAYCKWKKIDFNAHMEGKSTTVHEPRLSHIKTIPTVNKLAYVGLPFVTERFAKYMQKYMGEEVVLKRVAPGWVELSSKHVHKGAALEKVLHRYGIKPEEVMAFGDGENDMEMLSLAKYGIAMGNAYDTVKAVSFGVTKNVEEKGVLHALVEYGLVRK